MFSRANCFENVHQEMFKQSFVRGEPFDHTVDLLRSPLVNSWGLTGLSSCY